MTVFTVDTNADTVAADGKTSLREAIQLANADAAKDVIQFSPEIKGQTITLGSVLSITEDLIISSVGNNTVTVSGGGSTRLFHVGSGTQVHFEQFSMIQGSAVGLGGGVVNEGDLTLVKIELRENESTSDGGAVYNTGMLEVAHSTIAFNTSGLSGAAITNDGGDVLVVNSTLSGNLAMADGGAIVTYNSGSVQIVNSTLTGNRADSDGSGTGIGGAILVVIEASLKMDNTIVAGNFVGTGSTPHDIENEGTVTGSSNLIGDAATAGGLTHGVGGNIVGNMGAGTLDINSVLDTTLADNGGLTQTHALVSGGPAINAGNNLLAASDFAPLTLDQRLLRRTVSGTVDIGSFEDQTLIVDTLVDESDFDYGPGDLSLREAIELANSFPTVNTIRFAPNVVGTINLGSQSLQILESVDIQGPGANVLTISANESVIFENADTLGSRLSGVRITGGVPGLDNSGKIELFAVEFTGNGRFNQFNEAILNSGTIVIGSSTIDNNIAHAIRNSGTATITNSTISGNHVNVGAQEFPTGIVNENGATMTIVNSTIVGNNAGIIGDGVLLHNSIVAGNAYFIDTFAVPPADVLGTLAPASSFNLIGDSSVAGGLVDGTNGNIVGRDGSGAIPVEEILQEFITTIFGDASPARDNGGLTRTHLLKVGSPAFNAGNNALAVDPGGNPLSFEQRGMGFPRILFSTVDMGAVESDTPPPPVLTLTLDRSTVVEGSLPPIVATVSRSGSTSSSLAVTIMSDSNQASFPTSITIPAGMASSTFEIQGVDDGIADGTVPVTATVSASGFVSDSETFTVIETNATNGEGVLIFDDVSRTWRLGVSDSTSLSWFQTNPLPSAKNGWQGFVGDFNGDGLLDGMALNMDNLRFNFYRNTGAGTLANPVPAGALSNSFTWDNFMVGDYDGNGRAEVMAQIVSTGLGKGAMRSQDSSGVSRFYVTLSTGYEELITGDFNGDGIDDVVGLFDNLGQTRSNIIPAISISTPVGRRFTTILGSGQFGQSVATGGLHNLTVGDWNGDGRDDIAVRNSNGQIFTALTIGNARSSNAPGAHNFVVFANSPRLDPATYSNLFVAGNFTRDPLEDLMVLRDTDQLVAIISVEVFFEDISLGFVDQHLEIWATGVANGEDIIVGDFNGDGLDDVVVLGVTGSMYLSGDSEFSAGLDFGNVIGGSIGHINGVGSGRVI